MRIPLIYKAQVIAANTYANTHRPQTPQIVGRDAAGHGHHHGGGGDLPLALRGVGHPSAAERLQPPHPHIMPRVRFFLPPWTPPTHPLPATNPQKQGGNGIPIRYLSATNDGMTASSGFLRFFLNHRDMSNLLWGGSKLDTSQVDKISMRGAGQGEGRITLKRGSNTVERDKEGLYMRGAGQGEGIITIYGISRYTPISHAGNRPDIRNYLPLNPTKTGTVINSRIPHIDNQ